MASASAAAAGSGGTAGDAAAVLAAFEANPAPACVGDHSACTWCKLGGTSGHARAADAAIAAEVEKSHAGLRAAAGDPLAAISGADKCIAQMLQWEADPATNPKTSKAITIGGQVHDRLMAEFARLRAATPATDIARVQAVLDGGEQTAAQERAALVTKESVRRGAEVRKACRSLSLAALENKVDRELWTTTVEIVELKSAAVCMLCDNPAKLRVERTAHTTQSSVSCRWSVECDVCGWLLTKPYTKFSTSLATFACFVRGE